MQFFCGEGRNAVLDFMGQKYNNGGAKRNAKCLCKNGQNGDPWWKKSCDWYHKQDQFQSADVADITCTSKQPNNQDLDAQQAGN